jgi:hypothetical protein
MNFRFHLKKLFCSILSYLILEFCLCHNLLLCLCCTNLLHLILLCLILSLILHHPYSNLRHIPLLCLCHSNLLLLNLTIVHYLSVGALLSNHLIVTGQFTTWVEWMCPALTVGLYTGWRRNYLTVLLYVLYLACAALAAKSKFPD